MHKFVLSFCLLVNALYFAGATTPDLKTFPDIQGHWAKNRIEALAALGLIQGYRGTDFFRPDDNLTREDVAIMFLKASKIIPKKVDKSTFEDIYPNYWATPYIEEAAKRKFISGYENNYFFPRGIINRTEGVLMASNFAKVKASNSIRRIAPDLSEGYWANRYLTAAADSKILPPFWNLTKGFSPLKPLTRAEMIYMLTRSNTIRKQIEATFGPKWFTADEPTIKESIVKKSVSKESETASNQQETFFDAIPSVINSGESVVLSVFTNRLLIPKAVQSVVIDLSPLGRLPKTFVLDDGHWADQVAGDGVYTIKVLVAKATMSGIKVCPVYITDIDGNVVEGEMTVTIK